MSMTPVKSSLIHSVGHNGLALRVQFHNGAIYEFKGRPASDYKALLSAKSVGGHFNSHIRHHPNTCLRPETK